MLDDTTRVADRQLLDRVARGEADALRTLYRRHSNTVYALARMGSWSTRATLQRWSPRRSPTPPRQGAHITILEEAV